ncbi:MAG: hypothetical protein RL609_657 [Bacteroidota bacterium]|jgi:hypothetical protein
MKKIYSLATAVAISLGIQAQTSIFSDNFDSYTSGNGVVASNDLWSYWSTTPSDALVSTAYASSAANSAEINGQAVDLVLPVGPFTSGKYVTQFNMLIPSGSTGAYFNGLHTWSSTATAYEWGMDMFFDGAGACNVVIGSVTTSSPVANPIGEWFAVKIIIDLDMDSIWVKMNNNLIAASQWSLNNADGTQGTNQLSGFDFFGTDMAQGQGLYYIDDVEVIDYTGVNVNEEVANIKWSMFPNPAKEGVQVCAPSGTSFQVFNAQGDMVYSNQNLGVNKWINTSGWSSGVYFVQFRLNGTLNTKKLIVE